MEILDAQVHMWLSDRPTRPWIPGYRPSLMDRQIMLVHTGQSMDPQSVLLEMAEAGVDGGVLSPTGVYGNDNSFELESARHYPRKFCVVGWVDHLAPNLAETLEHDVCDGMVGIRLLALRESARHERNEFEGVLRACERLGCAISLSLVHPIPDGIIKAISRYEGIQFQIDHLGVGLAPPILGPAPDDPFENLPAVLQLAEFPNVTMKLTGAPSLSHQVYPFEDIWPYVYRIVDAFGPKRVMWGSDFTRTAGLLSYWDGTHYLGELDEFSESDLEWMYGKTLRRVFRWEPSIHIRPRA